MSITFFLVGGVIFSVYMYFTIWNIYNSADKSKRENYSHFGGEGCDLPEHVVVVETVVEVAVEPIQKPSSVQNLDEEEENEEDYHSF